MAAVAGGTRDASDVVEGGVGFVAVAGAGGLRAAGQASGSSEPVTFAQMTDAHIFDDGYRLPAADALRVGADDRDALAWAIDRITQYNAVNQDAPVDFAVFTGTSGCRMWNFGTSASAGCRRSRWIRGSRG